MYTYLYTHRNKKYPQNETKQNQRTGKDRSISILGTRRMQNRTRVLDLFPSPPPPVSQFNNWK